MNNFAIIPVDSIGVPDNMPEHTPDKLFDGKSETYWKPKSSNKPVYIQINYFSPHITKAFDIMFHQTARYIFVVDVLSTDNVNWNRINSYEIEGDISYPVRVNIPYTLTKSIKITFLSIEIENNTYLLPEISEIRVYGKVVDDEAPSSILMPPLSCPKGYYQYEGKCIPETYYDAVLYDKEEILDNGLVHEFEKPVDLFGIAMIFKNGHPDINALCRIKDKYTANFTIQKELNEFTMYMNNPVTDISKIEWLFYDGLPELEMYYVGKPHE